MEGDYFSAVMDISSAPPYKPHVRIVEQPASRALRFRYESELTDGRSIVSIPGVNSTKERRSYPSIAISGYAGVAKVVVSCVTKEDPYRPHPHNLIGEQCSDGVCTLVTEVSPDNYLVSFRNLRILCIKRRNIGEALRVRQKLWVDPFQTGNQRNQPHSIDLNAVRLCFQVFLPDENGELRYPLPSAVSDVIYDKKSMSDLQILKVSRSSGPATGGTEIILLCDKVKPEDTAVVLVEGDTEAAWEENGSILLIHRQVAIVFTTPPYRDPYTSFHVRVQIQIKRISDDARSIGVPYTYLYIYPLKLCRRPFRPQQKITSQTDKKIVVSHPEQTIESEPSDNASSLMGSSPHQYTALELMVDSPNLGLVQDSIPGANSNIPGPTVNPAHAYPCDLERPRRSYQEPTQDEINKFKSRFGKPNYYRNPYYYY